MLSESLTKVLDLGAWKLGLAAWIFTGYSPLKLRKTGHLIRLVDDEEIPHGTVEFRGAEEAQNEFLMSLQSIVSDSVGFDLTASNSDWPTDFPDEEFVDVWLPTNHFDRNWLINQIVNASGLNKRRDFWWLDNAIEHYFVPAYIRPDALSPTLLELRGYNSFVYPQAPDKIIDPPDVIPIKSRFEGKLEVESTTVLEAKGEVIKTLYKPSAVEPKTRFYKLLYEKIKEQITEDPEYQFGGFPPIEGWDKHLKPRPTGTEVIRIAKKINFSEKHWKTWTEGAGKDEIFYWESVMQESEGTKQFITYEKGNTSKSRLQTRVDQWFDRTNAGHLYLEYMRKMKKSFKNTR
jgi:hypothetical protein